MADRYEWLTRRLTEVSHEDRQVELFLEEIKDGIASRLPFGARNEVWWKAQWRPHVRAWLRAGWKVKSVNFQQARPSVTFERVTEFPGMASQGILAVCTVSAGAAMNGILAAPEWATLVFVFVLTAVLQWLTQMLYHRRGYAWGMVSLVVAVAGTAVLFQVVGEKSQSLIVSSQPTHVPRLGEFHCLRDLNSDSGTGALVFDIEAGGSAAESFRISARGVVSEIRIVVGVNESLPDASEPRPMKVQLKNEEGEILAEARRDNIVSNKLTEFTFPKDVPIEANKTYTFKAINESPWPVGIYFRPVKSGEVNDPHNGVLLEKRRNRPEVHRVQGSALSGCILGATYS
ncbi:hypothetical protein [Streptosporangium sp. NPDC049046]|uniref:hypothetical protein n=1 Tax=Streptosporangium sp. NPDC049046 TaxID=3155031 RepID=UPI00343BD025